MKIVAMVGSNRKESYNMKLVRYMKERYVNEVEIEILPIHELPFYNQDDELNPPELVKILREKIKESDGILFATPEYNASIPAVLKNALDVGSRPYGKSQWDGKPAAIVSVSPGAISAFGANHHLRQCLTFLNMPCLQQPEMYIGNVTKILDENGNINSDGTNELCKKFVQAFENWIEKF